jgi:hypothetical protein
MRKMISKRKLNNRRRVKKTRRHKMKGGKPIMRGTSPTQVKRIVLYGLSANPPTKAHADIIEKLSKTYDAVFVWASTNWLKLDASNPSTYDPLYKDEDTRSNFLIDIVKELNLNNVRVDYESPVERPKYNDQFTGISVKKFIDDNLTPNGYTEDNGIKFNKFTLKVPPPPPPPPPPQDDSPPPHAKSQKPPQNDIAFLTSKCDISSEDTIELWVCFGLDVVRDTPTWSPNNVFLTKATGIVMITRKDETLGDGLFAYAYANPINTSYYKMPFLNCITFNKDANMFVKRGFNFDLPIFTELNVDVTMKKLVDELIEKPIMDDLSTIKLYSDKLRETEQITDIFNTKYLHYLSNTPELNQLKKLEDKFLLLIEESAIKVDAAFNEASSTIVRKLAVKSKLGKKLSELDERMTRLVNNDTMKEKIYNTYGMPTIVEQLAIVIKNNNAKHLEQLANYIVLYTTLKTDLKALKTKYPVSNRYDDAEEYKLLTDDENAAKKAFEDNAKEDHASQELLKNAVLEIMQ